MKSKEKLSIKKLTALPFNYHQLLSHSHIQLFKYVLQKKKLFKYVLV